MFCLSLSTVIGVGAGTNLETFLLVCGFPAQLSSSGVPWWRSVSSGDVATVGGSGVAFTVAEDVARVSMGVIQ